MSRHQYLLYKTDDNALNEEYALSVNFFDNTNLVDFGVKTGGYCSTPGSGWRKNQTDFNSNDNNWHHFAVTYNGTSSKLFIDNIEVKDSVFSSQLMMDKCGGRLVIGRGWKSNIRFFNGSIDDIKIYNKALTKSEVSGLYNEGVCYQTVTVTDTLVINFTVTGFNPIQYANTIKVYPNPTSSLITIESENNSFGHIIKVINTASQEVYNGTINSNQETLDLSTWTGAGIYFLHLYDDKGNLIDIKKIVLQ